MTWTCMVASGTGSLFFLDEATADRSSSMNSEVYRAVLSAQLQRNVAKQVGQQMDNDPKDNADIN